MTDGAIITISEIKTTLAANLRPRGTTTIQNMTILPTPPPPEFVVISALARNNGVGGKRANIMASPAQLQRRHSPAPGNGPGLYAHELPPPSHHNRSKQGTTPRIITTWSANRAGELTFLLEHGAGRSEYDDVIEAQLLKYKK